MKKENCLIPIGGTVERLLSIGHAPDVLGEDLVFYAVAMVSGWVGAASVMSIAVIRTPSGANRVESEDVGNAILGVMVASTRSGMANGNDWLVGLFNIGATACCCLRALSCNVDCLSTVD